MRFVGSGLVLAGLFVAAPAHAERWIDAGTYDYSPFGDSYLTGYYDADSVRNVGGRTYELDIGVIFATMRPSEKIHARIECSADGRYGAAPQVISIMTYPANGAPVAVRSTNITGSAVNVGGMICPQGMGRDRIGSPLAEAFPLPKAKAALRSNTQLQKAKYAFDQFVEFAREKAYVEGGVLLTYGRKTWMVGDVSFPQACSLKLTLRDGPGFTYNFKGSLITTPQGDPDGPISFNEVSAPLQLEMAPGWKDKLHYSWTSLKVALGRLSELCGDD